MGGPANWAELQTSPSVPFTAQFEEKICSKELLGCDYSTKQWRAKLNRAGDDIKKGEAKLAAKVKAEKEAEAKKKRKQKQEKNEKEEFKKEQEKKKSAARRASLKGLTKALRSGPQYVRCETTQGPLLVKLQPTASPPGVERLLKLVRENFFTDVALWRNVPGFLVQFGLKSKGQAKEYERILDDKPLIKPKFTRGAVSFAGRGQPNSFSPIAVSAIWGMQTMRRLLANWLGRLPWRRWTRSRRGAIMVICLRWAILQDLTTT